MKTKYRIVRKGLSYYPQFKKFLFWKPIKEKTYMANPRFVFEAGPIWEVVVCGSYDDAKYWTEKHKRENSIEIHELN